jgi:hypothetical protein
MFNNSLSVQLQNILDKKKVKIIYPDGYKTWKEKFDYWYNITKDVRQTLDIIYGPGGGVTQYKGSLYVNSNLSTTAMIKPKPVIKKTDYKRSSGSLDYIRYKKK